MMGPKMTQEKENLKMFIESNVTCETTEINYVVKVENWKFLVK